MQLLEEEYARKRILNGCSVRMENTMTRDYRSAPNITLLKDFLSAPYNH